MNQRSRLGPEQGSPHKPDKEFIFYSKFSGKPLTEFKQGNGGNDLIYVLKRPLRLL